MSEEPFSVIESIVREIARDLGEDEEGFLKEVRERFSGDGA
ncbi:MAG: hypothetical protein ACP5E9_10960 [Candidatus Methanospirareceae archaeon]